MIKTKICNNWINEKNNYCPYGKSCRFAHGIDELKKVTINCKNGIHCYNEECLFEHPEIWNPFNNKKKCIICLNDKNNCNKKNKKYKHINKKEYNIDKKNDYEIETPKVLEDDIESTYIENEKNIKDIPINITFNINDDEKNNEGIKKIDEEKIFNKIKSQEILDEFNKCMISEFNFEKVLNTCEYNMDLMNKLLNKYIDIIKSNFDMCIDYSNDINFKNFCNHNKICLIDINNNVLSLQEKFIEYRKFILKTKNKEINKETEEK